MNKSNIVELWSNNSTKAGIGALSLFALLAMQNAYAVDVTNVVDLNDSDNDQTIDLNLNRLLPLSENNTWDYTFTKGAGGSNPVTARVGSREKIGGGCLKVNPMYFGGELALYLGNHGDSLSLYGIYLERWQGLSDVLLKFESRYRVEWKDFAPEYISGPVDEGSCQDTGRGRTERTGLVLLENLDRNLGEAGSGRGDINCKVKNTDLREALDNAINMTGSGQSGSGLATISGRSKSLSWEIEEIAINDLGGGAVQILMDFNPTIDSRSTDYSIHFDMTLEEGQGITSLIITDDGGIPDDMDDLSYTLVDANLRNSSNQLTPGGSCPKDSGSLSWQTLAFLVSACLSGLLSWRRGRKSLSQK